MTPVQIAYFKHFMFDKGIQGLYISFYKSHRVQIPDEYDYVNPESLEQFLKDQPKHRVLLNAFYFPTNSFYGKTYWEDINKKWLKYWELHRDNFQNDKYITLKGSFAILRQNWDAKQYWKIESVNDTYKRIGVEPPVAKGDKVEEVYNYIMDNTNAAPESINNPSDATPSSSSTGILEGFSLIETTNGHGGQRIGTNAVTINLRNNGYRVTFSTKQSEKLRKYSYKFVKLLTNPATNEIALLFNQLSGCAVSIKKTSSGPTRNVTINSKDIVEHIQKFYNIKKDYFALIITDTIQQDTSTIFKLKYTE